MARSRKKAAARGNGSATSGRPALPGQVVMVLQGGGALGAYQVGVYQALHEAGIEPDWVIGTSVGAINGAVVVALRVDAFIATLGSGAFVSGVVLADQVKNLAWR